MFSYISETVDDESSIEFDFLINGEFLRVTLEKHLQQAEISTETVVEIEYVERHPAPIPEDSLNHDDWVSCVQASSNWLDMIPLPDQCSAQSAQCH